MAMMTTVTGALMANGGERLPSYSQTRRYSSEEFVDVKVPLWYHNEPGREDILYELERVLEVCHSFFIFYFFDEWKAVGPVRGSDISGGLIRSGGVGGKEGDVPRRN